MKEKELLQIILKQPRIVRICQILMKADMHATQLYENIPHDWNQEIIRAVELGLVQRFRVKNEGVGQPKIMHALTERGRHLVKLYDQLEEFK